MPSLTSWLEQVQYGDIENFQIEDNNKRDRLEILNEIIGIQYDKPIKVLATDIKNRTENFQKKLKTEGNKKCALRLVPIKKGLPKLRVRGKTLKQNLIWFDNLKINHKDYKAEIVPHNDNTRFSAIFMIDENNILGEIVPGPHWQLTQGWYEKTPMLFTKTNNTWTYNKKQSEMAKIMKEAVDQLKIKDAAKKAALKKELKAEFSKEGYLKGYFEFIVWPRKGISFIDYNRNLLNNLKRLPKITNNKKTSDKLFGTPVSSGTTEGKIKIVNNPKKVLIKDNETIIVCKMTDINFVPLMQKAVGVITEYGGILSHAAIVSRELKKPCLACVKEATKKLKNGDRVTLDANKGTITIH